MHYFSDFSHLLHKMHEVTGEGIYFSFFPYFPHLHIHYIEWVLAVCLVLEWRVRFQGPLLCQLGVSFLPAGFWIPPSRCRSHPFILLQPRCCKVLCPACWCSPLPTPLGRWRAQRTRMGSVSLQDSLPHPFQLCKLQRKDLTTLCLSFPDENGIKT